MNDQEVREHLKQFRLPTNYMRFYTAQVLPVLLILYAALLVLYGRVLFQKPSLLAEIMAICMAVQLVLGLAVYWLMRKLYRAGFLLNRAFLILNCLVIPLTGNMAGASAIYYLAASLALLLAYTLPSAVYFEKRRDLFSSAGFDHGEMDPYYFAASDDPEAARRAVHRKPVLLSLLACLLAIAFVCSCLFTYLDGSTLPGKALPDPTAQGGQVQAMADELAATMGFADFDALLRTGGEADAALIDLPYPNKAEQWAQNYGWEDFQSCYEAMMAYAQQDDAIDPDWVFVIPEDASVFHTYDCPTFDGYDGALQYFDTYQEALDYGSSPCPVCNPAQ